MGRIKIKDKSHRQCNYCKETKTVDCFGKNKNNPSWNDYICKPCRAILSHNRFRTTKGQFVYSKSRAKQRKLEWNLTEEQYSELRKQRCHYCQGKLNETSVGLDRINNNLGYTLENVLPCCGNCNRIRSNIYTYEEMLKLAVVIREILGDRKL